MNNEIGATGALKIFLRNKALTKSKIKQILSNYSSLVDYEAYFSTVVTQELKKYHDQGFKIVLATGALEKTALAATEKYDIPIFDYIYSTPSHKNKGRNKLGEMVHWIEKNDISGFDYIGDAFIDLQIMKKANHSYFVGKNIVFVVGKVFFKIPNLKLLSKK